MLVSAVSFVPTVVVIYRHLPSINQGLWRSCNDRRRGSGASVPSFVSDSAEDTCHSTAGRTQSSWSILSLDVLTWTQITAKRKKQKRKRQEENENASCQTCEWEDSVLQPKPQP